MDDDGDAPSELEMELRRNLAVCKCSHVFIDHAPKCKCKCPEFRELIVFNHA